MTEAYLGLGTNLGDRLANLRQTRRMLDATLGIAVVRASLVYETQPVGGVPQDDYLNQVLAVETTLTPIGLLRQLHVIEARLHRQRIVRWGARTVDLDLLYFDHVQLQTPALTVPHPQIANRRFVLVPLLEVTTGALFQQVVRLLAATPDQNWVRPYHDK